MRVERGGEKEREEKERKRERPAWLLRTSDSALRALTEEDTDDAALGVPGHTVIVVDGAEENEGMNHDEIGDEGMFRGHQRRGR